MRGSTVCFVAVGLRTHSYPMKREKGMGPSVYYDENEAVFILPDTKALTAHKEDCYILLIYNGVMVLSLGWRYCKG
jgi:hypothetical protein